MNRRPEFLADCEHWRSRSIPDADIYDGQAWKTSQSTKVDKVDPFR